MEKRKILIGICMVLGIAISWSLSSQFTRIIQTRYNFHSQFFIVWFSTSWMSLNIFYPLIKRVNFLQTLNKDKISVRQLAFATVFFLILWMSANLFAVSALKKSSSSIFITIFSTAPALVLIISRIFLKEKFTILKIFAVVLSIGGIITITLARNSSSSTSAMGIIFGLLSALCAAFYKVLFKKFIGNPSMLTAAIFLTCLGLLNLIFLWPIILILKAVGVNSLNNIPWTYLSLSSIAGLFFNGCINFGIAYTYPLFISLGTVIGIPVSIIIDYFWNGTYEFSGLILIGSILIVSGFFIILFSPMKKDEIEKEEEKENRNEIEDNLINGNNSEKV